MRLAIFGCGGFGRELLKPAREAPGVREVVFVADAPGPPVLGATVVAPDELTTDDQLILRSGAPRTGAASPSG